MQLFCWIRAGVALVWPGRCCWTTTPCANGFRPTRPEDWTRFGHEGSSCRLTLEQQAALQNWITGRLPRSTRTIGAWLEKNLGFNYSRPGLIAPLHRLGFDYRKPHNMPRGLNDVRKHAFTASYANLLN